jgi:putative tricarboxylic transport membrane protein
MSARLRHCLPHFVMLLVALALYAAARRIETQPGRIGPDFWPRAIIVFMALLCIYEIVKRLFFGSEFTSRGLIEGLAEKPPGDDPASPQRTEQRRYPGMLLGGSALIAAFVAAVSWLGFFLSTVLFLGGFSWVGGFRRPLWALAIGVAGSLLTVVLFMRVAYISLPLGVGPFQNLSLALLRLIGVT